MSTGQQRPTFEPNPEQQHIIDHRGGHLQVIACAGSGKTEAISRRVAKLIAEGIKPDEVIAFTFTERAAASLKSRITLRLGEMVSRDSVEQIGPMYVGTIHSYCYRILQEHVPEFANFDVLDDHRHSALLSREFKRLKLERLGTNGHWRTIGTFIRNVDVVQNERINPAKFADTDFGLVYADYVAMLHRYRFLTSGQMITAAVDALSRKDVFDAVHGKLKHLFVDDAKRAQDRAVDALGVLSAFREPVCIRETQ